LAHDQAVLARLVRLVRDIQSIPYIWPCPPDAAAARTNRSGSCASKHALLAVELTSLSIESAPLLLTGPLVPPSLLDDPEFASGKELIEVHECLTVITPWTGPLRVDITWDPPLIERGLPGTIDWDGASDMLLAIGDLEPGWSVPRERLREAKEALRARLYGPGERDIRDSVLAGLSTRFERWRRGED
jgi:hypothetical protein